MVTSAPLKDSTVIQANQFPIKCVKLFGSGSAEITRTFSLSFLQSQDEPQVVEIAHLPSGLQSVDMSVTSTSGNVTIIDHHHTTHPSSTPSSQTLQELQAEKQRLEDERRLRQQSFAFLKTYMDSLAQCKSRHEQEAAQVISFFDDFVETGIARSTIIAELEDKLADVGERIANEVQRLSKLDSDLPIKAVAVLACSSQAPVEAAELTVTYVVKQVSWKPEYDLHVAMAEDKPSSTVRLDFRCSITQWTGENWANVSLALTTADQVSQLIQFPEPRRVDMSLSSPPSKEPVQPTQQIPSQPWPIGSAFSRAPDSSVGMLQVMRGGLDEARERNGLPPLFARPREMPKDIEDARQRIGIFPTLPGAPEADVVSQMVSQLTSHSNVDAVTHVSGGIIFIPTDHAVHHVLVSSLSLEAEFMRVAVPSADSSVYYMCSVKNTSGHVLLPGTVKAYLNDRHVSTAEILNSEAPQVLECALAVDTGVKAMYSQAPSAMANVSMFTGKATTIYTGVAAIQNTHPESVKGIIVRSTIPLPADPRITIVLKEPRGLAEIDEGTVAVKEGCLARWSTSGGRQGKQAGLFEWVCDVNPGTEVFKSVWEVCSPPELKLLEQPHS